MFKKYESTRGITIIALVITIIVVLILAGASIAILLKNNGVFTQASKAAILTEIARIEEEANLIYSDLVSREGVGKKEKVLMSDIMSQLVAKGYRIEQVITEDDTVTGINLDKNSITISANGIGKIRVTYEGIEYYAVVKGGYYKITLTSSGVKIDRTVSKIENSESVEDLNVTIISGNNVALQKIERNVITLKANSTIGISVLKVSYGSYSKECSVSVIMAPLDITKSDSDESFSTDYGLVDVIWLNNTTNTYSSTPNSPELYTNLEESKRLTPVTWTYSESGTTLNGKIVNWVEDKTANIVWYGYTAEKGTDGKEDNTTSMWANAKDSNGSYFVWIPRYAYRITYYSDESYTDVTGYYDGYGMWKAENGKKKYHLDEGVETVIYNGKNYIVHPAFMNDTNKTNSSGKALEDYARGGWDKNLTGIWVAKFEMSRAEEGSDVAFLSVPSVQSARKITIGNMSQESLKYDETKESHLLKNSEWGAVAYLTHSQYGRNGHEIDINNSETFMTGNGGGTTDATKSPGITNAYNTILGAKASTTGNVYGIYDLSGGSWEHVAGYNKNGESARMKNGAKMLENAKDASGNYISTKYVTAYSNSTTDKSSATKLFEVGKVGDATKEVRKTTESSNWFSDNSVFIIPRATFFGRGGGQSAQYSGIFYSDSTYGQALDSISFRIALGQ